jgi:myo-inositol-1(or 4)-monophosphatase
VGQHLRPLTPALYRSTVDISDSDVAIAAVQKGSAIVRAKYGRALARFDKSPTDFATAADIEAEEAILETLRAARPEDALVGEETGHHGADGARRRWLIDPLCGTLNYAAHTPLVAVNTALQVDRQLAAAASADPLAEELFWTDGDRAFLRRSNIDDALLPSAGSRLVDLNLDGPFPNAGSFRAVQLLANPQFAEHFRPRVVSTTLALAWVTAGRRAAYVTDGDMRDNVHFAAGIALCQAAGCVVTGLHGEPPFTEAGGLLAAADPATHNTLLRLIKHQ